MSISTARPLAVVTGASSGIGLELAKQFAANGYDLIVDTLHHLVQSFALALRSELKDTNVTVTSLMPGATDTEFLERADMVDTKLGARDKDDPVDVAREGFEALMAGKARAVSASLSTKLQGRGSRLLPDSATAAMHRKLAEPSAARTSC